MVYEIRTSEMIARLNSFGAELINLIKIDNQLEYIWQRDTVYWDRSAPVLFPFVGKLKDDNYSYKGKSYQMSQHGFARDREFELYSHNEHQIVFELTSDDTSLVAYPFEFDLYISYQLISCTLITTYKVVNTNPHDMLFSIGGHPAFNWGVDEDIDKSDYFLEFVDIDHMKRYFANSDGLISSVKSEEISLSNHKLPLDSNLFHDGALVYNDTLIREVILGNNKNNNHIKVTFDNFPYLGIWSMYPDAPFVCIEPWHGIADGDNSSGDIEEKNGIIRLERGCEFVTMFSIEV